MSISNPTMEIKKALPQLEEISNYNNMLCVSYAGWDSRMKAIETKNLKKYRRSLSWSSLSSYFNPCIICYNNGNAIEINQAKYKVIRNYLLSDEFNKEKAI